MAMHARSSNEPRRPRLRLLAILLALGAIGVGAAWLWPATSRQEQVLRVGPAALLVLAVVWLWVLVVSGLRWRLRIGISACFIAVVLVLVALLRIEGVSGDLVPVLGWRYATPRALEPFVRDSGDSETPPEAAPAPPAALAPTPWDVPQFLGAGADGEVRGITLERDWARQPPRELWRREIGEGWSSFAVVGSLAFTQEQRGATECVVCYRLASGEEIWVHGDATRYENVIAGVGPRATPLVDGDTVFTIGATGKLNALESSSGTRRWHRDVLAEHDARVPSWGLSSSPRLHQGRLIVQAAGRLLAYDPTSGTPLWSSEAVKGGYATPVAGTLAGIEQIIAFQGRQVSGHDPATGATLWSHPWSTQHPTASQPMVTSPGRLLISSGYGSGCELIEVQASADDSLVARSVWKTKRLKAKFTNVIVRGEVAFGLDDGVLVCLDLTTGQRRWKAGRYGHGQTLGVGDVLLVQAEAGAIVLVAADPKAHRELSRIPALEEKTWNHPTLAKNRLLLRNDREAVCYELPLAQTDSTTR